MKEAGTPPRVRGLRLDGAPTYSSGRTTDIGRQVEIAVSRWDARSLLEEIERREGQARPHATVDPSTTRAALPTTRGWAAHDQLIVSARRELSAPPHRVDRHGRRCGTSRCPGRLPILGFYDPGSDSINCFTR